MAQFTRSRSHRMVQGGRGIAWDRTSPGLLAMAGMYYGYHRITARPVLPSKGGRYPSAVHRDGFSPLASRGMFNTHQVSSIPSSIFLFSSLTPEGSGRVGYFIDTMGILAFSIDVEMTFIASRRQSYQL